MTLAAHSSHRLRNQRLLRGGGLLCRIVKKSSVFEENGMRFGKKIASFDLCKVSSVANDIRSYPKTDTYFYSDDGNTQIVKDFYGETLTEIPIPDMIQILEKASSNIHYRRYNPCIQMLKGFDLSEWKDLVVLHYGY